MFNQSCRAFGCPSFIELGTDGIPIQIVCVNGPEMVTIINEEQNCQSGKGYKDKRRNHVQLFLLLQLCL